MADAAISSGTVIVTVDELLSLRNIAEKVNELVAYWAEADYTADDDDMAALLELVAGLDESPKLPALPVKVCICGSTRFYQAFQEANYRETMAGKIVLTVGFYPHATVEMHGEKVGITPEQKTALDELHLRKIDLADEILVLNVGGYIGASTTREIAYAVSKGKYIRYLES